VQRLDGRVPLRLPGADQGVADAEVVEGGAEVAGAKLAAVVGGRALQAPAWPAARRPRGGSIASDVRAGVSLDDLATGVAALTSGHFV
jgi:hypothetical protein